MSKHNFVRIATVIFTIVGVVHLYRAFYDLPFVLAGWVVPTSLSWFAGLLALLLAFTGYTYWHKK